MLFRRTLVTIKSDLTLEKNGKTISPFREVREQQRKKEWENVTHTLVHSVKTVLLQFAAKRSAVVLSTIDSDGGTFSPTSATILHYSHCFTEEQEADELEFHATLTLVTDKGNGFTTAVLKYWNPFSLEWINPDIAENLGVAHLLPALDSFGALVHQPQQLHTDPAQFSEIVSALHDKGFTDHYNHRRQL